MTEAPEVAYLSAWEGALAVMSMSPLEGEARLISAMRAREDRLTRVGKEICGGARLRE